MRGTEILFRQLGLTLALLGAGVGCKPATEPERQRDVAPDPGSKPEQPRGAAEPQADPPPQAEPSHSNDREHADKLADLDDMCKALDHDYDDGTLTDYYRDIEPRTAWGKAQRDAGNQSIQPGRLLEKAVAELSPGAKDPALEHCRKLLDYLDDVE